MCCATGLIKVWQKRYFKLLPDVFQYFKSASDSRPVTCAAHVDDVWLWELHVCTSYHTILCCHDAHDTVHGATVMCCDHIHVHPACCHQAGMIPIQTIKSVRALDKKKSCRFDLVVESGADVRIFSLLANTPVSTERSMDGGDATAACACECENTLCFYIILLSPYAPLFVPSRSCHMLYRMNVRSWSRLSPT